MEIEIYEQLKGNHNPLMLPISTVIATLECNDIKKIMLSLETSKEAFELFFFADGVYVKSDIVNVLGYDDSEIYAFLEKQYDAFVKEWYPAKRAEFCAKEAVYAQDTISATNSGGIEPPRSIISVSGTEKEDGVYSVKVEYNYPAMWGCWSDCLYHVNEHDKVRTSEFLYYAKENRMTMADGKDLFNKEDLECFEEYNKETVSEFYKRTGLKEVLSCM